MGACKVLEVQMDCAGTEILASRSRGRARHYDPETGRFLQKDSVGLSGGDTNLYNYVRMEPINEIDPSGEGPLSAAFCVGLVTGSLFRDWNSLQEIGSRIESTKRLLAKISEAISNLDPDCPDVNEMRRLYELQEKYILVLAREELEYAQAANALSDYLNYYALCVASGFL